MIRFSFLLLKLENYLHVHEAADRSCLTFSIDNNKYLTNSKKGNGELVMKPLRRRDTLDIALWRKKSACLSSKDAFLRKNILKNPSRERASFDSLLASFGVSLNAKRCALNRKLNRNSCR